MNILVWKSYGDISVYEADTVAQLVDIFKTVNVVIENYEDELVSEATTLLTRIEQYIADTKDDSTLQWTKVRNTIRNFMMNNNLNHSYDDESFEYFEFTTVKTKCQ